ncbi:MAG: hypothetical protein IKY18_04785 [Oscillospiraceae bacterium]|nr:hypothetical protein [Oscillospiraceae bacterium]
MKKTAEEKIRAGIVKYQYLRQKLRCTDVSVDREYQRLFNGFFRMGRRTEAFYVDFYEYLEQHKNIGIAFADALTYLYEKQGRLEISFASKMVAMVDPSFPIWDSVVAGGHFGMKAPYGSEKNRLEKAIRRYDEYCCRYSAYMQTNEAKEKIAFFNKNYPDIDISDVKKLDFILWQER